MDSCRAWQFSLYGGEAISLQTWLCRHGSWIRKELSRVFSSQRNFMESQGEMSVYFKVTTTSPVQVCWRVLNLLRLTLGERGCTSQGQTFTSTTNEHSGWTHTGSGRTAASLKVFDYGDIICMHASSTRCLDSFCCSSLHHCVLCNLVSWPSLSLRRYQDGYILMHKVILSKLPTSLLTLGYAGFFLNFVEQNSHEIRFREEHMRRSRVIGAL